MKFSSIASLGLASLPSLHQASAAPTAVTVKIMPFGASIASKCWRADLWKKLQDANIKNIDFVGSISGLDCGFPYDTDNEGHSGSLATDDAKNSNLTGWLEKAKPDIIMVHIGTNDVLAKKPVAEIIEAYDTLIEEMRKSKETMKILFSNLIPLDPALFGSAAAQGIVDLNKAIAAWLPSTNTILSPVTLVDNFSGFNATKGADTVEGEHPNDSGNKKIANKFYQPLADAIRSMSAYHKV